MTLSTGKDDEKEKKLLLKLNLKKKRKITFKRLLVISKKEKLPIGLGLCALALNAITNMSFPWIMGKAVDSFSGKGTTSSSKKTLPFVIGGVFMVGSIASWIRVYYLGLSKERIAKRLRVLTFQSYVNKNMDYFNERSSSGEQGTITNNTGDIVKTLQDDVNIASETFTEKLSAGLRSLNSSVCGSILLWTSNPILCGVSLGLIPLVGVVAMTMSKYSRKIQNKVRKCEGENLNFAIERFSCISTVKLNGQEDNEIENYNRLISETMSLSKKSYFAQGAFMSFLNVATNASLLGVLYVGGRFIASGRMTAGDLTKFALRSAFVGLGFSGLSRFYSDMTSCLDAAARVFDVIDDNNTITNTSSTTATTTEIDTTTTDCVVPADTRGALVLNDISFAYNTAPSGSPPILNNISLSIAPGSFTCIIGESGAGKSTVFSLASGLYSPILGTITLDGIDIHSTTTTSVTETKLNHWRHRSIGAVEQDSVLLSGTILEAIMYGLPGSTTEDAIEAAKIVSAHDFIMQLPQGYETPVGARGSLLSGGQRARVAIARAILKSPRLLLLDEVTSGLDKATESELIIILKRLSRERNCSVVIFTHSRNVMKACDMVHLLEYSNSSSSSSRSYSSSSSSISYSSSSSKDGGSEDVRVRRSSTGSAVIYTDDDDDDDGGGGGGSSLGGSNTSETLLLNAGERGSYIDLGTTTATATSSSTGTGTTYKKKKTTIRSGTYDELMKREAE